MLQSHPCSCLQLDQLSLCKHVTQVLIRHLCYTPELDRKWLVYLISNRRGWHEKVPMLRQLTQP